MIIDIGIALPKKCCVSDNEATAVAVKKKRQFPMT
jgi:hypothetical protein